MYYSRRTSPCAPGTGARQRGRVRDRRSLSSSQATTWLYRIVVNAALQKIRKKRKPKRMTQASVEDVEIVDWSPGPESQTMNAELRDKLEEAIGELPEELRTAVILRDVEQLSTEEEAKVVEISVPAFKGPAGMPVGVQVIGRRGAALETLRAAQWLGNELGAEMV